MRVRDFAAKDRVRHRLNGQVGTVRTVTPTQIEVDFDAGWSGTYDALWFAGCDYLEKLEELNMGVSNGGESQEEAALTMGLTQVVANANMIFNGSTDPDNPEFGLLVMAWKRTGSTVDGRVLSNKVHANEIKRAIEEQITALKAALAGAPEGGEHG